MRTRARNNLINIRLRFDADREVADVGRWQGWIEAKHDAWPAVGHISDTVDDFRIDLLISQPAANRLDGLHGLYGGDQAGIRIEDIGTVQNKDATRTRVKWYCGLALKSTKSVARLSGVTNV